MGEPDPLIVQEAEIVFEVREVDSDPRYRARLIGAEHFGEGDSVREAVRGAVTATIEAEFEDALGELWEG